MRCASADAELDVMLARGRENAKEKQSAGFKIRLRQILSPLNHRFFANRARDAGHNADLSVCSNPLDSVGWLKASRDRL